MIGKLSGIIEEINIDNVVLDVLGVGYIIYISNKTKSNIELGQKYSFFIIHNIYENGVRLYGFANKEEKDFAEILTTVQGISYKIALSLLGNFEPEEIRLAIVNHEHKLLRAPGIGDKLANRIVTELHDAMMKLTSTNKKNIKNIRIIQDATSVLVNLGYQSKHAFSVVHNILDENPEIEITELVRLALKII